MKRKTSLRKRVFFAHSIDGQKPETWQTLAKHLQAVSLLTSMLAKKFGAEQLGAIVGLLHDLGKYSHQFQAYIAGRSVSPDHATAGAREIQRFTGAADPKDRVAALIGAYCIAGHHSGLPNWSGDRALSDRLKKQLPALDPTWQEELTPDLSSLFPKNFKPHEDKDRIAFQLAMFGRMLFSCLVDAGARIETCMSAARAMPRWRRSSCGSADRNYIDLPKEEGGTSRSSCGSADRNNLSGRAAMSGGRVAPRAGARIDLA